MTEARVILFTSRPEAWTGEILYTDSVTGEESRSFLREITNNPVVAFSNTDIVFVTQPAFMREELAETLNKHLRDGAWIGMIPGSGGIEPSYRELLDRGRVVFGLDRVPCIARLTKYGRSVAAAKKEAVRCGTIPAGEAGAVSSTLSRLLDMECLPLPNYLSVTFTPSNQILHTSRLYELLRKTTMKTVWERAPFFYAEWDNDASRTLLACDAELRGIADSLPQIDLSRLVPLTRHYDVRNAREMTAKIRSIAAFRSICLPMKHDENGFRVDMHSRYFTEDFPYGLAVLRGYARLAGARTPTMDAIMRWYEGFSGIQISGEKKNEVTIPQKYGLTSPADIYDFFS